MSFDSGQVARDGVLIRRFGESVRYTAVGEGTETVIGVFDNPSRQSQVGNRAVSAKFPMISVLLSEVPKLRKGDAFEIGGVEYRVKEPATDVGEVASAKLELLK